MSLRLENPKSFLALLLFIGFVFTLIGLGWIGLSSAFPELATNPGILMAGTITMISAVILWVLINRKRMGL